VKTNQLTNKGNKMTEMPKQVEDLVTDLEDMMETAEAVHGEQFANFAAYLMNSKSVMKLMAIAVDMSIEEGKSILANEKHPIVDAMTSLMASNAKRCAEAAKLTEEQMVEVFKFTSALAKKTTGVMNTLNKEEE
jgi:hypothetical protein